MNLLPTLIVCSYLYILNVHPKKLLSFGLFTVETKTTFFCPLVLLRPKEFIVGCLDETVLCSVDISGTSTFDAKDGLRFVYT